MSLHFFTRRVPSYLGLALVSWASAVLVSIAIPFAFHISVFSHSLFFTCHWISFVFLPYDRRICTHSADPSLTHLLREFAGLGLALADWYPMLWSQRRSRVRMEQKSHFKFLHWLGFEPRTLQSNGHERYH